jgi:hypothetical protein
LWRGVDVDVRGEVAVVHAGGYVGEVAVVHDGGCVAKRLLRVKAKHARLQVGLQRKWSGASLD